MHWIILFIVTWILFFIVIDKKKLKYNIYGGIISFVIATIVDYGGTKMGIYKFYNLVIPWFGCSAFYKFGPILNMGIIFCQFVPTKRWLQVLNILVFVSCFVAIEYMLALTGNIKYFHWNLLASFIINLSVFTNLTWITTTFLRKPLQSFQDS